MGRMRWDAPSLTIRTEFFKPEKGQYLHPQWDPERSERRLNRVITHREAARIQDFPDDFLLCGSKIQIAKQIGNAVPGGRALIGMGTYVRTFRAIWRGLLCGCFALVECNDERRE